MTPWAPADSGKMGKKSPESWFGPATPTAQQSLAARQSTELSRLYGSPVGAGVPNDQDVPFQCTMRVPSEVCVLSSVWPTAQQSSVDAQLTLCRIPPSAPGASGVAIAVQVVPFQWSANGMGGPPAVNLLAPTAQQSPEETQVTPQKPPLAMLADDANDQLDPFHSWRIGKAPALGVSRPTAQHSCALGQAVPRSQSSPPSCVAGAFTMFQPEADAVCPVAKGRVMAAAAAATMRARAATVRGRLGTLRPPRRIVGAIWSLMVSNHPRRTETPGVRPIVMTNADRGSLHGVTTGWWSLGRRRISVHPCRAPAAPFHDEAPTSGATSGIPTIDPKNAALP